MFTIRKYEAQYQNRLLQFLEICLPQSDRKFEPDGRHKMYRNVTGYFEHFWCLFDGEDMIGTAALKKLDSGRCELKALYLLEKYHKKGLGRRLFKRNRLWALRTWTVQGTLTGCMCTKIFSGAELRQHFVTGWSRRRMWRCLQLMRLLRRSRFLKKEAIRLCRSSRWRKKGYC